MGICQRGGNPPAVNPFGNIFYRGFVLDHARTALGYFLEGDVIAYSSPGTNALNADIATTLHHFVGLYPLRS